MFSHTPLFSVLHPLNYFLPLRLSHCRTHYLSLRAVFAVLGRTLPALQCLSLSCLSLWCVVEAEDGAGPSIMEQLNMRPFACVIQSVAITEAAGGHGMVAVHTLSADLYSRLW